MAAALVITIVGTLASVIGIGTSNLPGAEDGGSSVRVHVGSHSKLTDSGGNNPRLLVFSEQKEQIGHYVKDGEIQEGSFSDLNLEHGDDTKNVQPKYLQVMARDDALCIAYLTQVWPGGEKRAWLGDMGKACGQPWAFSDVEFGPERHRPSCMWLDANHDAPAKGWGGMQIHVSDFYTSKKKKVTKNKDFFCNPPVSVFVKDPPELELGENDESYNKGKFWTKSTPKRKRSLDDVTEHKFNDQESSWSALPRRKPLPGNILPSGKSLEHQLVITTRISHNVTASCSDETFISPDIANLVEGIFCEMSTRTLYEVCSDNHRGHTCFDHNVRSLRKRGNLMTRGLGEYKKVHNWAT